MEENINNNFRNQNFQFWIWGSCSSRVNTALQSIQKRSLETGTTLETLGYEANFGFPEPTIWKLWLVRPTPDFYKIGHIAQVQVPN